MFAQSGGGHAIRIAMGFARHRRDRVSANQGTQAQQTPWFIAMAIQNERRAVRERESLASFGLDRPFAFDFYTRFTSSFFLKQQEKSNFKFHAFRASCFRWLLTKEFWDSFVTSSECTSLQLLNGHNGTSPQVIFVTGKCKRKHCVLSFFSDEA